MCTLLSFPIYFKHIIETSLRTHLRMPPLQHDYHSKYLQGFLDVFTGCSSTKQVENAKKRVKEGILLIERLLPYCCAVLCCYTPSVVGFGLSTLLVYAGVLLEREDVWLLLGYDTTTLRCLIPQNSKDSFYVFAGDVCAHDQHGRWWWWWWW